MSGKQYIASLSYGKDSIAMIHVIRDVLNLPLDRIITADVWATDTIPAELPPMVEFKEKADRIIKERWGIVVEHLCAMRSFQIPLNVGGGTNAHTKTFSTLRSKTRTEDGQTIETAHLAANATTQAASDGYTDSRARGEHGATQNSKCLCLIERQKVTYQSEFYKIRKPTRKSHAGKIEGFPFMNRAWCNGVLKRDPIRSFIQEREVRWCSI